VNLLATDVTHVGIGVVFAEPETDDKDAPRPILLTQNFYSKIGADAPVADMPRALRERVDGLRTGKGLQPLAWDRALSEAAQLLADGVASGTESRAARQYDALVEKMTYKAVETHRVVAPSFASLDGFELWSKPVRHAVGVGVAKIEKGGQAGALIAIVAVGER
jgi:hypothetical protein